MYTDLEEALTRELDDVAVNLVVPPLPSLPASPPRASRWQATGPLLVAAVALVAVMATIGALLVFGGGDRDEPAPAPSPSTAEDDGPVSRALPTVPVVVSGDLYIGGEPLPGQWLSVEGTATGWVGQRANGTWWWGFDAQPQRIEGQIDQAVEVSPGGGYHANVEDGGAGPIVIGADTEFAGEGFGQIEVPDSDPAPRVGAVTDDGLVVTLGSTYQVLWRPLVDGETVDLAETAPGQVVIGNTAAGVVVNEGAYDETDGTQGQPYLARLDEDGTLTRLQSVPTHDVLEASEEWLAYVPPGTVAGEASGTDELRAERVDGGGEDVLLTPPEGWIFLAPGFRWESSDRLLVPVVTEGPADDEGLARCRPEPASCVLVDVP